jgi:hypothetical protein
MNSRKYTTVATAGSVFKPTALMLPSMLPTVHGFAKILAAEKSRVQILWEL